VITGLVKEGSACCRALVESAGEHLQRAGSVEVKVDEIGRLNDTLHHVSCLYGDGQSQQ
jgi:hypothetical protein